MEISIEEESRLSVGQKWKRLFTEFPYRDPTWLVAIVFVIGSIDFTINAFFILLPMLEPSTAFETLPTVAIPATIFIGAFMFTAAGILDMFGSFNADGGLFQIANSEGGGKRLRHKPSLLGSDGWMWRPTWRKFKELLLTNKPFQAGLMQLFGGVILTISAFAGFPGFLDPTSPVFPVVVFAPQVFGGFLFFLANAMLVIGCEQDRWWRPKPLSASWQAAFQNSIGGLGFALTGVFLLQDRALESAIATFVGSWAFLIGSLLGWYAIMDIC